MKIKLILVLLSVVLSSCSTDNIDDRSREKQLVGNQYAHLLFDTAEECEAAQAQYFINCAQTIRILSRDEAEVMLTDILYKTDFYVDGNKLVIQASENTYEFSKDIVFEIQDNGNLKRADTGSIWKLFEEDFYE